MAEEIGIHIGDGSLIRIIDKAQRWFQYRYRITGDLTDEYLYHKTFIYPLLQQLYNCPPVFTINSVKNSIQTVINSRAVFEFKHDILHLPNGSKKNISIPDIILKNEDLMKRCIVGIMDTDFTLSHNLCLHGSLTNHKIVDQLVDFFDCADIGYSVNKSDAVGYFRIRKESSAKIIEEWQLHNPKHLSKYHLTLKYKEFLTFTHTHERLAVLNGNMTFDELMSLSKERRKNGASGQNVVGVKPISNCRPCG